MIVVGVGDMKSSYDAGEIIRTYALGSCIGLSAYDPVAQVGGLLHFQLPVGSTLDASVNPYRYGNSGVPAFLNHLLCSGAQKARLEIVMCGGADIYDEGKFFNIGAKNIDCAQKILRKNGWAKWQEDTGGSDPRTLTLYLTNGCVSVHKRGVESLLLGQLPVMDFYELYPKGTK